MMSINGTSLTSIHITSIYEKASQFASLVCVVFELEDPIEGVVEYRANLDLVHIGS